MSNSGNRTKFPASKRITDPMLRTNVDICFPGSSQDPDAGREEHCTQIRSRRRISRTQGLYHERSSLDIDMSFMVSLDSLLIDKHQLKPLSGIKMAWWMVKSGALGPDLRSTLWNCSVSLDGKISTLPIKVLTASNT